MIEISSSEPKSFLKTLYCHLYTDVKLLFLDNSNKNCTFEQKNANFNLVRLCRLPQ